MKNVMTRLVAGARAVTGTRRSAGAAPVLVLLDIENMQMSPDPRLVQQLLDQVTSRFPDAQVHVVASCSEPNRPRFGQVCRPLGIPLLPCASTRSAADKVLVGVARTATAVNPKTRLVVMSADHAFAELAPALVVLPALHTGNVATQLAAAAGEVVFVDLPARPVRRRRGRSRTTRPATATGAALAPVPACGPAPAPRPAAAVPVPVPA